MNAFLYLASYLSVAVFLSFTAWSAAKALRLPALTRVILGLTATPLVLPLLTLLLTLVWPDSPRKLLLAWPGLAVLGVLAFRIRRTQALVAAIARRFRRRRIRIDAAWRAGLTAVFVGVVVYVLWNNSREPVAAHDALVYFNEARHFADQPRWGTYLAMTNPPEANATVRGHTHTWFYTSLIAPALLATEGMTGAGHDLVARVVAQGNLLHLLLAIGGLTWVLSQRSIVLSLGAMAAVVSIPYISNGTISTEIDGFRLLPLVLAATVLSPVHRGRDSWRLSAVLLAAAAAAHTLNIIFGPVLLLARLLTGMSRGQWRLFFRFFLPFLVLCALPVAAFYTHVWVETGRFFGSGMYYHFYVGPLASTRLVELLSQPTPSIPIVLQSLRDVHGNWPILAPLSAILIATSLGRMPQALAFIGLIFVLSLLVLLSGCWVGVMQKLTQMMLHNFRYPLGILIFGPPLVVGVLAQLGPCFGRWKWGGAQLEWPKLVTGLLTGIALFIGCRQVLREWPINYDVVQYLQEGEREVARLVDRYIDEGAVWLTDRKTVAYYAPRPPVFLYSPAGAKWLILGSEEEAKLALHAARVRLVAFYNLDPEWWPRTVLYAALRSHGFAERIRLPGWEIFVLSRDGDTAVTMQECDGRESGR